MDVMLMARNYNLWPWVGRASETLQNHGFQHRSRFSTGNCGARRGFWPAKTLPSLLQAGLLRQGPGYRLGRQLAAQARAAQGGPAAGARSDRRVAARSLGTLTSRSSFHPARAGISECRLRLVERSTRSNNAQRPSSRRNRWRSLRSSNVTSCATASKPALLRRRVSDRKQVRRLLQHAFGETSRYPTQDRHRENGWRPQRKK